MLARHCWLYWFTAERRPRHVEAQPALQVKDVLIHWTVKQAWNWEVDWPKDLHWKQIWADGSRCGQGMFMWKWYLRNRGKCQIDLNQLCCRQVAEKVTNDKAWVSICPIFTGNLGRFYVFLVFGVLTRFHIVSIIYHFSLLTYSVPTLKPKHLNTQDGHPISKYFQISLDLWLMIDFISHSSSHSRTASETVLLPESIAGGGLWCSQWAWWWPVEVCEGCRVGQKEARREVLHW